MENIVLPEEYDFFIQSIREHQIYDIGSKSWIDHHEIVMKLNQQALIEVTQFQEELVKELMINYEKIPVLVHEIYSIMLWRQNVLPLLLEIEPNPKATFMIYTAQYHEAVCVSLLELVLFHENGIETLGETANDLIDYCAQAIVQIIGLISHGFHDNQSVNVNETIQEEMNRQRDEITFKIGMKCLVILSYIVDKVHILPFTSTARLVRLHDIPCLLSEVVHSRPWIRRSKNGYEKYFDDKWLPVVGDKLYKLSKSEAQTWMCMRQLLFNQTAMQQYEITDFRQRELAKCHVILSEQILDQIPPLCELKHHLCSISITSGLTTKKTNLILEDVPIIKEKLLRKALKYGGFSKIAEDQADIFLAEDQTEIVEMAKRLNDAYNTDVFEKLEAQIEESNGKNDTNFCENCNKPAEKKCAKCNSIYYCSRECQVANWTQHKKICDANSSTTGV